MGNTDNEMRKLFDDLINMGRTILKADYENIYEEGISIGEPKGEIKGLFKAVYTLETKGYNEETACNMIDVKLEDYRKFKEKNNLG